MKKNEHIESQKRLQHIVSAINKIETYVSNENVESYIKNDMVQGAVLFQFTVIGEAINHVENSKLEKYDYPWYQVRSFRNFISHEYFHIKDQAVWNTIANDLPKLKSIITQILEKEF